MSPKLLTSVLRSVAITLPCCMLLLLLASGVLTALQNPDPIIPLCAYAVLALGAAASGFLAVRLHRAQGLLCGGMAGLVYGAILLPIGLMLGMENALPAIAVGLACALVAAACGYLALPKAPSAQAVRRTALLKASARVEQRLTRR